MLILAIRFLAELAGVAALGFVGATVPGETPLRVALGIGAPLALIVVWAIIVAPNARNRLPLRVRSLIGTALLVAVGGLLTIAGQPAWGIALVAVVLVDEALSIALGLDHATALMRTGSGTGRSN